MTLSGFLAIDGVEKAKEVMQVALGRGEADLAIVNAKLLNVYTGELLENSAITVKDKWVAYVGNNPHDNIGKGTEVIDAGGMTIIPGFIEGHIHLAPITNAAEFLQ